MIYNGNYMRVNLSDKKIFHETDSTLSIDVEVKKITHASKDTDDADDWTESEAGAGSWEMSGSALVAADTNNAGVLGFSELFDKMTAKAKVPVSYYVADKKLTDLQAGESYIKFTGEGLISKLSYQGQQDADGTCSYTITGSKKLSKEVITIS